MKKIIISLLLVFFLAISLLLSYNVALFFFFTPEAIEITGDKNFIGAKVYASNGRNLYTKETLIGIMIWDKNANVTYSKDIRAINGDLLYKLSIHSPNKYKDQFEMPGRITNDLDFKVVTVDNQMYVYHAHNDEDLAYDSYPLTYFKRIK